LCLDGIVVGRRVLFHKLVHFEFAFASVVVHEPDLSKDFSF
jgi:hypothetical protein